MDHAGTKKLLYSLAKIYRGRNKELTYSVKDKEGKLLVDPEHVAEGWGEYFHELLNVEDKSVEDGGNQLADPGGEEDFEPITGEEVKTALSAMKDGKAAGDNGIPVEILNAAGPEMLLAFMKLITTAYKEEVIPEDWQRGVICPIKKMGDGTICGNYRGITLLSHTGKIYSRIIERGIRTCVEGVLKECQHGYRPGRSTVDLLFTMKMMMEKSWKWNVEKFVLFIDLEKAFDRVKRQSLWEIIADRHYSIPPKLRRVTQSFYRSCLSCVKPQTINSEWVDIRTGVKQGDVFSPLLFIIFIDKRFRDIGDGMETLAYADDVAVITDDVIALQDVVDRWRVCMDRIGMKINTEAGKTEFMHIGRSVEEYDITIDGSSLNQVPEYNYLGACLNSKNLQVVEIDKRIAKFSSNTGMIYPLLKDTCIPTECKVTI